jgi:hypothetical protein
MSAQDSLTPAQARLLSVLAQVIRRQATRPLPDYPQPQEAPSCLEYPTHTPSSPAPARIALGRASA